MGCVGSALLLHDNYLLIVNLVRLTADHGFALIIPFLFFTGTLVSITSPVMGCGLFGLALLIFVVKLIEDGFGFWPVLTFVWMLATFALALFAALSDKSAENDT